MKDTGKRDTAAILDREEESELEAALREQKLAELAEFLATMRASLEERLKKEEVKASISDYLKLLQVEKEIENRGPEEIEARWVEPKESVTET